MRVHIKYNMFVDIFNSDSSEIRCIHGNRLVSLLLRKVDFSIPRINRPFIRKGSTYPYLGQANRFLHQDERRMRKLYWSVALTTFWRAVSRYMGAAMAYLPWSKFSGVVLGCFTLSRQTSWTEVLLIQPEHSPIRAPKKAHCPPV